MIFDETPALMERARAVFSLAEVGLIFAGRAPSSRSRSRASLHDLMILNMSPDLQRLGDRGALAARPIQRRIVGLMGSTDDPRSTYLEQAANVHYLTRPSDAAALDYLLRRLLFETAAVPRPRRPSSDPFSLRERQLAFDLGPTVQAPLPPGSRAEPGPSHTQQHWDLSKPYGLIPAHVAASRT